MRTVCRIFIAVLLVTAVGCRMKVQQPDILEYVDPTIGNVGHLLQPTRPTVHLPNQMTRMSPDRNDYLDDQIDGFPLNIISHRIAKAFRVKPYSGDLDESSWNKALTYDHDHEMNRPWYFSTLFIEDGIKTEYSAGEKTGFFRFIFTGNKRKYLLFSNYYENGHIVVTGDKHIRGLEKYRNVNVHMYGSFSHTVIQEKFADDRMAISWEGPGTDTIDFRYSTSFISPEQAKINFEKEFQKTSFEDRVKNGRDAWRAELGKIQVEGGTEAQKRSFYTAMYRCYERMVNISEDGQYFSGFDNQIHSGDRNFYVDDWVWDSYLAHHPLRMILNPDLEADMLQSYVNMYVQSGWMPTFPVIYGDHECMNGFHSTIVFWDAFRKGIRNFDYVTAFDGCLKNAEKATMLPWRNGPATPLDYFYHTNGFFPALHPGEKETCQDVHPFEKRQAVAVTLGHSYDDGALSEWAKELGKSEVYHKYAKLSMNYKNLWNDDRQMFMPKDKKGNWIPIDPKFDGGMGARDYYGENNGWIYLWQVQHDIEGLIDLMGGKHNFENKLDQLFRENPGRPKYEFWAKLPDATGLVGQFSMGNEPGFHIPYLYHFTDSPWKTQKWTRFLLDVWFRDHIFGIPGDEDGGGMSAFVVFSSMGFYPVRPGVPEYVITSPVFDKITIQLPDSKKFTLVAHNNSKKNKYIQRAKLNGADLERLAFSHQDLLNGGLLELFMGELPAMNLKSP